MAHGGYQIPVPSGLHAENAEAVFRIVERDPLDQTGQDLGT
jgi:hypothetical protein